MCILRFTTTLLALCGLMLSSLLSADTTARYQVEQSFVESGAGTRGSMPGQHEWLVWKYDNRVQLEREGTDYSVIWVRMKDGSLQRKEVYPSFRTVVSYEPGDALALGLHDNWERSASLFDGNVLSALQEKGEGQLGKARGRLYEGDIEGRHYRVLWQAADELPAVIEIRRGRFLERISLIEAFDPGKDARYPRPDLRDDFDDVDYADLGDNETNPLVQAMHHTAQRSTFYPGH